MSNILIGYEWGLGMGHLARMLPIARALSNRNHQVVFFLYNSSECVKVIAREPLPILPVMGMTVRIPELGNPPRFHSYGDVVASISGYYTLTRPTDIVIIRDM